MASVGLEMEDIFDDGGDLDENVAGSRPLPGFDDEDDDGPMAPEAEEDEDGGGTQGEGGEGDEDVLNRLKDLSKGAAKKRVMRPQPKLNDERLRSNRGLPILPKLCEGVKFKGKGYERQNLRLMMGKMEHWAHRLFPKLQFDDFIARLEKFSHKKTVMNTIKRMRMDMPILDDDYVSQYDEDGDPDAADEAPKVNGNSNEDEQMEIDAEEAFEAMIQEEKARREREEAKLREEEEDAEDVMRDIQDDDIPSFPMTPHVKNAKPPPSTPAPSDEVTNSQSKSMTPAQIARMERNKQLAMERRMARLGTAKTGGKMEGSMASPKLLDTTQAENTPLPPSPFTDAQRFHSEDTEPSKNTPNTESLHLQQSLSENSEKESESLRLKQTLSEDNGETGSESLNLKQTVSEDIEMEEDILDELKQTVSEESTKLTESLHLEQTLSESSCPPNSDSLKLRQSLSEEKNSDSLRLEQSLSEEKASESLHLRQSLSAEKASDSVDCDNTNTNPQKDVDDEKAERASSSQMRDAETDTLQVSESLELHMAVSEEENAEKAADTDGGKRQLSDGDADLSLKLSVSDSETKEDDTTLDDSVIA